MTTNYYTIAEDVLEQKFRLYQRWRQDGQKPHVRDFYPVRGNPTLARQDYYDTIRDCIVENQNGVHVFHIKVAESAGREIWASGRFIAHACSVTILDQHNYTK